MSEPKPDPTQKSEHVALVGDIPSPMAPPSGCVFRTRCPHALDVCAQQVPALAVILVSIVVVTGYSGQISLGQAGFAGLGALFAAKLAAGQLPYLPEMPDLLAMMRRRGYRFLALDDALKDAAYRLPDEYFGPGGFSWIHRWSKTKGMPPKGEPDEPGWIAGEYGKLQKVQ